LHTAWPRQAEWAQGGEIHFGVNAGRFGLMMPQHAADFAQARTVPEKIGGQCIANPTPASTQLTNQLTSAFGPTGA